MDQGSFAKASEVRVGKVLARCEKCGSTLFLRSKRERRKKADTRVCARCGTAYLYTALREQIAGEVMRQADKALEDAAESRKKRD